MSDPQKPPPTLLPDELVLLASSHQAVSPLFPLLSKQFIMDNRTTIAATASAVIGVGFGFPLDSIKTRMQVSNFKTMAQCVQHVKQTEGLMGLYRGVVPTIAVVATLRSLAFGVYHKVRGLTLQTFYPVGDPDQFGNVRSEDQPVGPVWSQHRGLKEIFASTILGGAAAGYVQASVNSPMELVKIQRQLDRVMREEVGTALGIPPNKPRQKNLYQRVRSALIGKNSSFGAAKKIVQHKGPTGLWYGFPLHAMRDSLGTVLYWGTYELSKHWLTGGDFSWNRTKTPKPYKESIWSNSQGKPTSATLMLSGALAGVSTWVFAFPIDLVKSRVQKSMLSVDVIWPDVQAKAKNPKALVKPIPHRLSPLQVIRKVWSKDGFAGFYRGVGATMLRAVPIHALNFWTYEKVLEWCARQV